MRGLPSPVCTNRRVTLTRVYYQEGYPLSDTYKKGYLLSDTYKEGIPLSDRYQVGYLTL